MTAGGQGVRRPGSRPGNGAEGTNRGTPDWPSGAPAVPGDDRSAPGRRVRPASPSDTRSGGQGRLVGRRPARSDDRRPGSAADRQLPPTARRAVARGRTPVRSERPPPGDEASRRFRGSVARRGARVVATPDDGRWRGDDTRHGPRTEGSDWDPEEWVDETDKGTSGWGDAGPPAAGELPVRRRPRRAFPDEVQAELHAAVGTTQRPRTEQRLAEAVKAYERDRYDDALRTLRPVARSAPTSATVRELHALTLYRLGRWKAAIRELDAFHALTGSFDQHPVLIDCYRAARRWRAAERVWEDLRQASPVPEVLTEGRIAIAGARADQGDLKGAIELLERTSTKERPPPLHHLRLWYALADLYERAGDIPRARTLFRAVMDHDPTLFDTPERLATLA